MATKYTPSTQSRLDVGYTRMPSRMGGSNQKQSAAVFTRSVRDSMEYILSRFQDVVGSMKAGAPDALAAALLPTFEKSQKYCPVDTGALLDTAHFESGYKGNKAYARISYGGNGALHYAPIVHERTDLSHKAPTRSKWLQAAVEEDISKMKRRFTMAYKRMLG